MELLLAFIKVLIAVAPDAIGAVRKAINELGSLSSGERAKLLGALPDDTHESVETKWDSLLAKKRNQ